MAMVPDFSSASANCCEVRKVLFPSLRLGYVIVPEPLMESFAGLRGAIDDHPALSLQPALHAFIDEGHFASHIRRLRRLYAERQEMLLSALKSQAGGLLSATSHEAGMHLVADLNPALGLSDKDATRRAAEAGLIAPALSEFYQGTETAEGLPALASGMNSRRRGKSI